MKTRKRVATLFILGALLLSTVTPVLAAPNLNDGFTASIEFDVPGCDQFQVEFTGVAEGGMEPHTYEWDFGDGEDPGTGQVVIHTYEAAGTYTVTLTVTDNIDATAEASVSVTIKENPEASASADPERAILDSTGEATIQFTFSATGGEMPYDFVWDFADGSGEVIEDTMDATFTVTHTYTITGTYQVTLEVTDALGCSDEDTVVVTVSSEEAENLIGDMLARFFNITNDEINRLRDSGWGYGEIAKAYFLAQLSGEDVEVIIAMRGEGKEGSGWGQIMKEVLGFAGLHGYNLGLIMSGREVPAPVQNLADFCQMEVGELTELLQETGAKFSTIRMACRLAQEVDSEDVTLQQIIERHQDGMTWREIREESGLFSKQMEALARGCGMEGNIEQLAGLVDQWGRQTVKRACRLAQAAGMSVTQVLKMLDGGMTWDQIKEDLGLVAEQGSQGQGHGKGQEGQGSQGQGQAQGKGKDKGPKH